MMSDNLLKARPAEAFGVVNDFSIGKTGVADSKSTSRGFSTVFRKYDPHHLKN